MIYFYMSRRTIARGWTDRHEINIQSAAAGHSQHTLNTHTRSLRSITQSAGQQFVDTIFTSSEYGCVSSVTRTHECRHSTGFACRSKSILAISIAVVVAS